jgi:hypothetical protein
MGPLEKFKSLDLSKFDDKQLAKLCLEIVDLKDGKTFSANSEFVRIREEYVAPVSHGATSLLEEMVKSEVVKRFSEKALTTGADSRISESVKESILKKDPTAVFGPGCSIKTRLPYDVLMDIISNS